MTRNTGFMVGTKNAEAEFVSLNPDTEPLPKCMQGGLKKFAKWKNCYPTAFVNQDDGLPVVCGRVQTDICSNNGGGGDCEKFNPATGNWESLGAWDSRSCNGGQCATGDFHPKVGLIMVAVDPPRVMRSTDYGVTFERLADAPATLSDTPGGLTIVDEDTIFFGPGTNRKKDPQKNGEFYKLSLSANTWTKMATFPKYYYQPTCTLWQRAPENEAEIYCFGSNDEQLWIYNVARDEWRESGSYAADKAAISGASLFTYEDELYVLGGYSTRKMGNKLFRMNSTTLKWENTGIATAQHYYFNSMTFVNDICN